MGLRSIRLLSLLWLVVPFISAASVPRDPSLSSRIVLANNTGASHPNITLYDDPNVDWDVEPWEVSFNESALPPAQFPDTGDSQPAQDPDWSEAEWDNYKSLELSYLAEFLKNEPLGE